MSITATEIVDERHPYGKCECDGLTCCGGHGPAAFRVTRDGRSMRLCTRCDLPGDKDKTLLVTAEDNAALFMEFDPIGGLCIAFKLGGSE